MGYKIGIKIILAYFSYFEEWKSVYPHIKFWMAEPIYIKLSMYIMTSLRCAS
jgi:hypothetical protein